MFKELFKYRQKGKLYKHKNILEKNSLHFELMIFLLPRFRNGKKKNDDYRRAKEDILNLSQAGGNRCAQNSTASFQKQLLENEEKA